MKFLTHLLRIVLPVLVAFGMMGHTHDAGQDCDHCIVCATSSATRRRVNADKKFEERFLGDGRPGPGPAYVLATGQAAQAHSISLAISSPVVAPEATTVAVAEVLLTTSPPRVPALAAVYRSFSLSAPRAPPC